jgi:hypothetical protein
MALSMNGRMAVRRVTFTTLVLLAALVPAFAEVRIISSPGGEVTQYLRLFAAVRATGERVVIDGPCLSACTLLLSTIPNNRICVTRRAVLGFHAARAVDRRGRIYAAPEATKVVAATYPAPVRAWIARHGGLTSRLILLRGRELAAMYPRCT